MNLFQTYLFNSVLRTMVTIVGGLVLVALLTQGLTQLDLIVENRQSTVTFLYVSVLAAPQVIALLLPVALFIAATSALNRAHRDSEIIVSQAAGMSRLEVASPILRLAVMGAILHLVINLWVQPAAYRELRETVTNARSDLAATLVRPGEFNSPADNLTVYVGEALGGGELRTLLISDTTDPKAPATYIAKSGALTEVDGVPAILMRDARVQTIDENGQLSDLTFDQYPFEMGRFLRDSGGFVLKPSDRFLPELFRPDLTNYYDLAHRHELLAEGHSRIASPLLNLTMGMLAVIAVLGGDFSRRGYQSRIVVCTVTALMLQLISLASVSAAEDDVMLNIVQYAAPVGGFLVLLGMFLHGRKLKLGANAGSQNEAMA